MAVTVCLVFVAAISDIDSDYTSDVNYPLSHNHHNNTPLHQLGPRQPNTLPANSLPANRPPYERHDNYHRNDGSISDGEYEPWFKQNGHHPYYRDTGVSPSEDNYHIDPQYLHDEVHPDRVDGGSPYRNLEDEDWETNGYKAFGDPELLKSKLYVPHSADQRSDSPGPVPRSRGATPDRMKNGDWSASANGSPVPAPRRSPAVPVDEMKYSPNNERRSDVSEPFFYNSRRANDG